MFAFVVVTLYFFAVISAKKPSLLNLVESAGILMVTPFDKVALTENDILSYVIEKIVVHTMNQESIIDCVEAQLQFVSKKENVYVAFTNQLKLPNACPLLLNMRLLG